MTHSPPQIIVRAFSDEPIILYALQMQPSGKYVNVCRDYPPPSYIGWPVDDAFDYNADDFAALQEAFSEDDKGELLKLYNGLRQQSRTFIDLLDQHGPFR